MSRPIKTEIRVGTAKDNRKVALKQNEDDVAPWDLDTKFKVVGTNISRIDGRAKVTGRAEYSYDKHWPGMLFGVIYRSPVAKGKLTNLDLSKALESQGVRAAMRLKEDGSKVRFVGDAVAAIAADSLDEARDALAKIDASYAENTPVIDFLKHDDAPARDAAGAVTEPWSQEDDKGVGEALAAADVTLDRTYGTAVQTHSSLETHGLTAKWDGDDLEVWASTQATFSVRSGLSRALRARGIDAESVRVHAEFVGGGFGSKFAPGDEGVAAAVLAFDAKAPVKLMLDRFEEHTCTGNRPSCLVQIRAGAKRDGTITGWDYRAWGGPGYSGRGGSTRFPGHYVEDAKTRKDHTELATDTDAARAMRAPGSPQGYFASEVFLDELATSLGMDPLALRVKNDAQALRGEEWELGAKKFNWANRRNPTPGKPHPADVKSGADQDGRYLRGAGLASARWPQIGNHGGRSPHGALCRIHQDGRVEIRNGAQDIGTGMKTVMVALVAEELGIDPSRVRPFMGDTHDPSGPGSGGSTTTPSLAPVVRHAAGKAQRALTAAAAIALEVDADTLNWKEGKLHRTDGDPLEFDAVCKMLGQAPAEGVGERFPNDNKAVYQRGVCGCQFAEVRIDRLTGKVEVLRMLGVQDCGLVLATKLAESQVLGAMIQGMSYAVHEQRVMDQSKGRMLNGDFLNYKVAGSLDLPELEAVMISVANGGNNTGAAGLGEPPSVAAPAAVANAVANAIGVPVRTLPITPDKVLAALDEAANAGTKPGDLQEKDG